MARPKKDPSVRKSSTHSVRDSSTAPARTATKPISVVNCHKSGTTGSKVDRAGGMVARADPILAPEEQARNDAQVARILRRAIEEAEIEGNIRIESLRDLKLANEAYYVVTHQREERRNGAAPLVSISLLASGEGQMTRIGPANRRKSVIETEDADGETLQIEGEGADCPDST